MAELWTNEESKRLYGFIAAGGTLGGLLGTRLTKWLVQYFKPVDLLLVSMLLLLAALIASLVLRRVRTGHGSEDAKPVGGSLIDGFTKLTSSPYLLRIALFVFFANVVGTFFYSEQLRLAAAAIPDQGKRAEFFADRDGYIGLITLAIEVIGTAAILRRFGVTAALTALPVCALFGTLALSFEPTLWVAAAVMIAERVTAFSLSGPAIKVMYTLTSPDEKYKVQNFVDTVVYRGGDAVSGWLFKAISGDVGFAALATPAVAIPLGLAWLWTARKMGDSHREIDGEG